MFKRKKKGDRITHSILIVLYTTFKVINSRLCCFKRTESRECWLRVFFINHFSWAPMKQLFKMLFSHLKSTADCSHGFPKVHYCINKFNFSIYIGKCKFWAFVLKQEKQVYYSRLLPKGWAGGEGGLERRGYSTYFMYSYLYSKRLALSAVERKLLKLISDYVENITFVTFLLNWEHGCFNRKH